MKLNRHAAAISCFREAIRLRPDFQEAHFALGAELVAGINAEHSYYEAGGMTTDRSLAEYLSSTLHPISEVELTAGLRHDHFDTAGDAGAGPML